MVSARVPARVRKALEVLALEQGVNLSEYLRWTLIEHVRSHGDRKKRRKP
ncbi:MAG: hypothetical protein HYY93_09350 [Planctomycetes bacterium]|nr:hypothetical protein [Planctomycetota bacterium]